VGMFFLTEDFTLLLFALESRRAIDPCWEWTPEPVGTEVLLFSTNTVVPHPWVLVVGMFVQCNSDQN